MINKKKSITQNINNPIVSRLAKTSLLATLVASSCLTSGCSPFSSDSKTASKKDSKWSWFSKKKEYQEPRSMVVIWSEDTLVVPGKPLTRGFGGRIYFYNEKNQAIPVDGELVVYGFDETARTSTGQVDPAADKRFRYTAEQFTSHFSESELGASYSVWLPWDVEGGPQREITLIPTFTSTTTGQLVRGESSKVQLSGKKLTTPVGTGPQSASGLNPQISVQYAPGGQSSFVQAQSQLQGTFAAQPPVATQPVYNQVATASATMPTNAAGFVPQFNQPYQMAPAPTVPTQVAVTPTQSSNSTTIELPRSSSIYR